jgi:hypothetical protein
MSDKYNLTQEPENYTVDVNSVDVIELSKRIFESAAQQTESNSQEDITHHSSMWTRGGLIVDGQPDSGNTNGKINDYKSAQIDSKQYNLYDNADELDVEDSPNDERRNWILKKILSHKLAIGFVTGLTTIGFIGFLLRRKL